MKPLYTKEEYNKAKAPDKLPCECYVCTNTFYTQKRQIISYLNGNRNPPKYCSPECLSNDRTTKTNVNCTNCNGEFLKLPKDIKKSKSGNHFCSKSCSASYNNKNKKHGTRRSKLEIYLEEQLTLRHPNLPIDFNKKDTINSELDIYIPSLMMAFEINGIYHYQPIHGYKKLCQIMENDLKKSDECRKNYIMLHTIDVSDQKYFKPSTSQKYLDFISNIINERLLTS